MSVLWKGLAVVDAQGRVVVWRGSETPKLYHSEEQGAHARLDGCALQPVTLLLGAAPHAREHVRLTPRCDTPPKKARRYKPKRCVCRAIFTPSGPRATHCPACRRAAS